ncbi:SBBP repeat-containing protein [Hymenobacter sp. 15J16-1T3B]|uniref:SBBP repeat-containing protein n=1 Tax=Hymenobacter sp. 15J16-1T3B TaxID=2886941 RepID=UPI001D10AB58|nr:SBBP repeat-containing protein [Hymenobacter sp. 15J16-1T3B]MCC3155770.1 SBBP repeat-containing protein [Hymenobacter sp. 15J16-1T3B]
MAQTVAWTDYSVGVQLAYAPYTKCVDMKVDASGNVYLTYTYLGSGRVDYITVKVGATGILQWTAEYNGTGNGTDRAAALAVDANGNVYVTGTSMGPYGLNEFATVKYNAAGTEQWVRRYGANGFECRAKAMAIDGAGNIYITGITPSANDFSTKRFDDVMTLKYSSDGVLRWAVRGGSNTKADDPVGIGLDGAGNVYVAGSSVEEAAAPSGTWRVETVYLIEKYLPNGIRQWSARHIFPRGGGRHEARAMTVDAAGNTYVTGTMMLAGGSYPAYYTVKYNSSGALQWFDNYAPQDNDYSSANAIAVSSVGNVYVTGRLSLRGVGNYYGTLKYSPTGLLLWGKYYGYGGNNEALGVAVDASDNAYVTGLTTGSASVTTDYTTLKYHADGPQLWVKSFNGYGKGDDRAETIVADRAGNVFVTGTSNDGGPYYDAVTIKYAPAAGLKSPSALVPGVPNSSPLPSGAPRATGTSPTAPGPAGLADELSAFPLPFTSATTIRFGLAADAAQARLQVFDALGRVVATLHEGPLTAGRRYSVQLPGATLAAGLYVCRLSTPTTTQQIRLTRSR